MKRRVFNHYLTKALALLSTSAFMKDPAIVTPKKKRLIKAKRLQPGATVGLIAPGSPISEEKFEKAINNLENLDFKLKYTSNAKAKYGYLAGRDEQRLADIESMFADDGVDAVWCIRGGYGCSRLLAHLPYKLIRNNPKILIGYSDITALLQAIHQQTGLVCFHGPVGTSDFTDYTLKQMQAILMNPSNSQLIQMYPHEKADEDQNYSAEVIRGGRARGVLAGGNLSLLTSLVGTPYELDLQGKLLFIEDVGEQPYRIDRMLTQVLQSGKLKRAAGIVLGIFEDCQAKNPEFSLSLKETLKDRLYDLGIPVLYGFSFGHIANQCTFPLGIEAELDTQSQTVRLLDSSVL